MPPHGHRGLAVHFRVVFDAYIQLRHMTLRPLVVVSRNHVACLHEGPLQVRVASGRALARAFPAGALARGGHQSGVADQPLRIPEAGNIPDLQGDHRAQNLAHSRQRFQQIPFGVGLQHGFQRLLARLDLLV